MWGIGEVSAQGEPLIWFAGFVVSGVDFAEDKVSVSVRVSVRVSVLGRQGSRM